MEDDTDLTPIHHICQRLISERGCSNKGSPPMCFNANTSQLPQTLMPYRSPLMTSGWLRKFIYFPKVYAADSVESTPASTVSSADGVKIMKDGSKNDSGAKEDEIEVKKEDRFLSDPNVHPLVQLARDYIEKESGLERVRLMYKKNFKGESGPELQFIKVALVQTFAVTFFMKYVPEYRFRRDEFIREHRSTVFRTHIEALRRMQDQVSLRAALEGVSFASKITIFSACFLFTAQTIAAYRNKTSVIEYTIAAGFAGGLARMSMGLKGFIAGTLVGSVLGTIVGGIAYSAFSYMGLTQDVRHLHEILEMLEVERHIVGEDKFKQRIQELKKVEPSPSAS